MKIILIIVVTFCLDKQNVVFYNCSLVERPLSFEGCPLGHMVMLDYLEDSEGMYSYLKK